MFDVIVKKATHLVEDNSTTILTGIGVAGTITTAVLTGRASFKAARMMHKEALTITPYEDDRTIGNDFSGLPDLTLSEKIRLVGPQFVPAVGMCTLTVSAIIFANRLSARETAAMAAMYSMSDKTFQEYKEKVQEKLGQNKETALRDEIAQNRVDTNPPDNRNIIITGSGEVLCYDTLTDRYFESTVEKIKQAENAVNLEIVNADSVPLSRFYDHIGLMPTPFTEDVGFNIDNRCEVQISATMSKDNRPCMAIDFASWPKPNYNKVWP
jgi:hypothetical protein